MKVILKTALRLTGIFAFLETLLFRPVVVTAYSSGDELITSPLLSTIAVIAAMILAGLLSMLLAWYRPHAARLVIPSSTIALPACALLLLGTVLIIFNAIPPVLARATPLICTLFLGIATITQIHSFTRSTTLGSQGLLLASGSAIILSMLISFAAFAISPITAFGALIITALILITGIALAKDRLTTTAERGDHLLLGKEDASLEDDPHEDASLKIRSGFSPLTPVLLPVILESLLCTMSLGLTWRFRLFEQAAAAPVFFLVALCISGGVIVYVYRYWVRRMDIDALLTASLIPLTLSVLIAILDGWLDGGLIFVLSLLSELVFLLLAWTSALMLGRLASRTEAIAPGFVAIFLLPYACFMALAQSITPVTVEKTLALASLGFILYMVAFLVAKVRKQSSSSRNTIKGPAATRDLFDEALRRKSALLAEQHRLSGRESELLPLLVMGLSAREIGERVFISPATAKTHRYRIYDKLDIHTHDDLVALIEQTSALESGN